MSKIEMLKKLTPKAIMGEKIKAPAEPTELFTIYGVANAIKRGETSFGPWVALVGRFEAVKGDVTYTSSQAFIPEPLHTMIADAVVKSVEEKGGAVQFACTVILKPRPDLVVGYEYIAKPLVEAAENDELAALRNQVSAALALPAPTDEPAPTKGNKK